MHLASRLCSAVGLAALLAGGEGFHPQGAGRPGDALGRRVGRQGRRRAAAGLDPLHRVLPATRRKLGSQKSQRPPGQPRGAVMRKWISAATALSPAPEMRPRYRWPRVSGPGSASDWACSMTATRARAAESYALSASSPPAASTQHEHGGASLNAPCWSRPPSQFTGARRSLFAQPVDKLFHVAHRAECEQRGGEIEHHKLRRRSGVATASLHSASRNPTWRARSRPPPRHPCRQVRERCGRRWRQD